MAEVAEVLGLTPAYVKGVVTFYTMYHQHPVGKKLRAGVHDVALQHLRRRGGAEGAVGSTVVRATGSDESDGKWSMSGGPDAAPPFVEWQPAQLYQP